MQSIRVQGESSAAHLHYLPCSIDSNGEAPVKQYLESTIRSRNGVQGSYEAATFRGRPLAGQEVQVPSGYGGVVLHEEKKPVTDVEERQFTATHHFSEFHYWNLETVPSGNDKLVQAIQWVDVAGAIHKPVKLSEE
eukprot:scpid67370/ scgid20597/ Ribonuclease H2 subunit C; Ribonuclease HI subunit C